MEISNKQMDIKFWNLGKNIWDLDGFGNHQQTEYMIGKNRSHLTSWKELGLEWKTRNPLAHWMPSLRFEVVRVLNVSDHIQTLESKIKYWCHQFCQLSLHKVLQEFCIHSPLNHKGPLPLSPVYPTELPTHSSLTRTQALLS